MILLGRCEHWPAIIDSLADSWTFLSVHFLSSASYYHPRCRHLYWRDTRQGSSVSRRASSRLLFGVGGNTWIFGIKRFSGERCEREAVMAQVEDHVARNLSQLPDFGVELSSMEFTSVRAFSQTLKCLLESWKKKFNVTFYLSVLFFF